MDDYELWLQKTQGKFDRGVLKSEYTQLCVDITCCEEQITMITYEIVRVWLSQTCAQNAPASAHTYSHRLPVGKSVWCLPNRPGEWLLAETSTHLLREKRKCFLLSLPAQSIVRSSTISILFPMLFLSLPPRKSWAKKHATGWYSRPGHPVACRDDLCLVGYVVLCFFSAKLANAWAKHIRKDS